MWLVVDVHPGHAFLPSRNNCLMNELSPDAAPAEVRVNSGVQNEAMDSAVPGQIDETDQKRCLKGANVRQAMLEHRLKVSVLVPRPGSSEQRI